jgi:hypothetical protein
VPVSSNTLAQQGNSILTSASFQNSLDYIFRGSAFGEVDEIKGISSCIMTGSKSRNGTGIVDFNYSESYLEDEDNLMPKDKDFSDNYEMDASQFKGPCYATGEISSLSDILKPEERVSMDEKLEPPRMEVPSEMEDLFDLEEILGGSKEETSHSEIKNELDDAFDILEIPEAPREDISEDLI